jgi:hypothetical protein
MTGSKLDALTLRSSDLMKEGDDCSLKNQMTIIKPENILQHSVIATLIPASLTLIQLFTDGYKEDWFPNKIPKLLRDGIKQYMEISLVECDEDNNLIHYHQRMQGPNYEP